MGQKQGHYNHMILPLKRWLLVNAQLLAKHDEKGMQLYSDEKNAVLPIARHCVKCCIDILLTYTMTLRWILLSLFYTDWETEFQRLRVLDE